MLRRVIMLCLLSSVLLVGEFFPSPLTVPVVSGQSFNNDISVVCGTEDLTGTVLPSNFPGFFFRLLDTPYEIYRFERISQNSSGETVREELQAPLSESEALDLGHVLASPNGQMIVFIPRIPTAPLTLWNIATNETARLTLTQSEFEAIHRNRLDYGLTRRNLVWRGSSQLMLLNYDDFGRMVLGRTIINVSQNPLALARGMEETFDFSWLPAPVDERIIRHYSPQGTFITQQFYLDNTGLSHFQVYDVETGQLLFEPPNTDNKNNADPFWSQDERTFFYYEYTVNTDVLRLIRVNVEDGFSVDASLDQTLQAALGEDLEIGIPVDPMFSNDGQHFLLSLYDPEPAQQYLVFHTPDTNANIAMCFNSDYSPLPDDYFSFWSPDGRYFAYFDIRPQLTYIFDSETGNTYGIPTEGYVGWAKGPNVPPVADAGTDQVVPPIGTTATTAQVTLDASGSTDSDGTIIRYIWKENGQQIARGVNPTVNLAPGVHTLTLEVTDHDYDVATDEVVITVSGE
ncbi:MAG: PKD domain-containing protein [bacterium]|nr:PKD domain-containing protein [bacterium]